MNIELEKFLVKKGKEIKAHEWMQYLNDHLPEVTNTLTQESMFIETIFSEIHNEQMYLYWISYQGTPKTLVENSSHEVDIQHMNYWRECIDTNYKSVLMTKELSLFQQPIHDFTTKELTHD